MIFVSNRQDMFKILPKVDNLLNSNKIIDLLKDIPRNVVVNTIRETIEGLRKDILSNNIELQQLKNMVNNIEDIISNKAQNKMEIKFKRVINATGTIIHTNLGRSLIDKEIMEYVVDVVTNYSNLEYNLLEGSRGLRYDHIEGIITRITGAEAALVVNNNAAAVMLVLNTMAKDKEVIVSRGELVEIGGSFRVPDVMEQSGAKLIDVGTTNKTHLKDYTNGIGEETGALLKVHTSNYRILGFTKSVSIEELVKIGEKFEIPVIEDIGSGVLVDLEKYGIEHEPTVKESIESGIDIVTFSGDKLLGGPQAGIIVGKKKYIDKMKKNPLTRALRVDKFTIATLELILRLYLDEEKAIKKIPTLKMLTMSIEEVSLKANILSNKIIDKLTGKINVKIVDGFSQVGGGALPLEKIPTKLIELVSNDLTASEIERRLRKESIPVVVRVFKDKIYIDLRTVKEDEFDIIVYELERVLSNHHIKGF
ncbi:L-seryl-tRNA(Sec) selenium transferase [Clostridiisalibacter paucivorans]|uniref:L-seryl-tRNA(Sec) selenium transferase n=1 Tax=Clostridiisalibacter paucivorans TaxID=408753 RepID=UPI000478DDC6